LLDKEFWNFEFVIVNFLGCQIKKNGREKEWCCWLTLWRCPKTPINIKLAYSRAVCISIVEYGNVGWR
jgi:hypothetical protein